jgi:hypothetical protein
VWLRGRLKARRMAVVFGQVWESVLSSSVHVPDELAKLESIVADLEMAIPTGTVARQMKLKRVMLGNGKRGMSGGGERGSDSDGKEMETPGDDSEIGQILGEMLMEDGWAPANFQSIERILERWGCINHSLSLFPPLSIYFSISLSLCLRSHQYHSNQSISTSGCRPRCASAGVFAAMAASFFS